MESPNIDLDKLGEYPIIAHFMKLICAGKIPITTLLTYDQMHQLYDLLWVEIYEAQQKKEKGNERILGEEEAGKRKS